MKPIVLHLPEFIYEQILKQARRSGLDEKHYLSNVVIEHFEKADLLTNNTKEVEPKVFHVLPDTLEQIYYIARYVWKDGLDYADAVRKVANKFNVQESTVRDKCTRRISFPRELISTDLFKSMLANRDTLLKFLCRRFPKNAEGIEQRFKEMM